MTRVDFYILQTDSIEARHEFACKLIERALRSTNEISVMLPLAKQLEEFDQRLWAFKPESFIPHGIVGTAPQIQPVMIAHETPCDSHHQVMINLQNGIPNQFSRFERIAEIVVQAPKVLESTRKNYKFYTSRGYPTFHHKI